MVSCRTRMYPCSQLAKVETSKDERSRCTWMDMQIAEYSLLRAVPLLALLLQRQSAKREVEKPAVHGDSRSSRSYALLRLQLLLCHGQGWSTANCVSIVRSGTTTHRMPGFAPGARASRSVPRCGTRGRAGLSRPRSCRYVSPGVTAAGNPLVSCWRRCRFATCGSCRGQSSS